MVDWKKFLPSSGTAAADTSKGIAAFEGASKGITLSSGDSIGIDWSASTNTTWTTTGTADVPLVRGEANELRFVDADGNEQVVKEKEKTEIKEVVIPEQEPLSWTPQKGKLLAVIHKDDVEDLDGTRLYKGPVTQRQVGGFVTFSIGTSSDRPPTGRSVSRGMVLLKEFVLGGATVRGKNLGRVEKWLDAEGQIYYRKSEIRNWTSGAVEDDGGAVVLIEGEDSLFFSSGVMTELAKEGFGVLEIETPVEEADFYTTYGEEIVQYVDPIITELREPWGGWGDEE